MWVRRPGLPVLTDALSLLVEEAFGVAVDPACLPSIQRGILTGCAAVWWVRFWGVIPTCPETVSGWCASSRRPRPLLSTGGHGGGRALIFFCMRPTLSRAMHMTMHC